MRRVQLVGWAVLAWFTVAVGTTSEAGLVGGADDPSGVVRAKLKGIFASYWEDVLRSDPLDATFNGDHRFDDRLAIPTQAEHDARVARNRATLAALRAIDPAPLSGDERVDREVLIATLDAQLAGEPYRSHLIPISQQSGLHLQFAQAANFHPTATVGDIENYLRRLETFPDAVDATIKLMRQGMDEKRVPPRVTMGQVLPQLRALAKGPVDESPLFSLAAKLPADWDAPRRDRYTERIRRRIAEGVQPAFVRLADFIEHDYLPACRESIGLSDTPDGPAHYAHLARTFTTTDLTPDQIHAIGLEQMAKTRAAMEAIRTKVGFEGDLPAFFARLRSDPKLKNRDEAEIMARYREILTAVDAKLPLLFGRLPRTDYGLKAIESYRAKAAAAGYYYTAPEDGSRPGYFYVNTANPTDRSTYTMQSLAYHEAVPGHHLQFALALEVPGRPAFRRFGYVPAFSEGWGLYSESLPGEVGLYADPYAEMGRLEYDAWRCSRLVVDTGMHHMNWSRDRAIAYLEANTAVPRAEIVSEVDRYIAWPGQALAYKIGELKIREIRAKAEAKLGPKFDIRAFHDKLLSLGSVPLDVLERFMAEP